MTVPRRHDRIPIRLPEPVDVNDPVWRARAWQKCFDALDHLDECIDSVRDQVRENHAEVTASITALTATGDAVHAGFQSALDAHEAVHRELVARKAGSKHLLGLQFDVVKHGAKFCGGIVQLGLPVALLKLLGVI